MIDSAVWNCRTLLHMHTRTCLCGALFDLRAARPGPTHHNGNSTEKLHSPDSPQSGDHWNGLRCIEMHGCPASGSGADECVKAARIARDGNQRASRPDSPVVRTPS